MLDPAGAYFITAEQGFRAAEGASAKPPEGPLRQQGIAYGPGIPHGGRPADEEERERLADHHGEQLHHYNATEDSVLRRWGPQLRDAVDELLDKGRVTVHLDQRTIDARIIRFWRGNSLVETRSLGPKGGGESLSRISRNPHREPPGVLLDYLVRADTKG